jgi:hypothetical protein
VQDQQIFPDRIHGMTPVKSTIGFGLSSRYACARPPKSDIFASQT